MKNSKIVQERHIYITDVDLQRLQNLIEDRLGQPSRENRLLEELEAELLRAELVSPQDTPPDVITMNSTVRLQDLATKKELEYTLVYPAEANIENNRVSILAPVGIAMIGYRVGDTVTWKIPGGTKRLKVKKILYQPEAVGDFHR